MGHGARGGARAAGGRAATRDPQRRRPAATPAAVAPAAAGTSAPSAPRPPRAAQLRSASPARIRGALLLAAIVAAIVVAIVLLTGGGGSSSNSASSGGGGGETTSSNATSTQKSQAKEDKRITLTPPDASSKAVGVAEVLSEGNQYAFYLAAQHLAPSKGNGFFYAVWLYNSPSSYEALSRAPDVGASGNVQGGALLPKDAAKYHTMLLTRETAPKPTKPGPVILRGAFALH